jgi:uncharacterized protein DUF3562
MNKREQLHNSSAIEAPAIQHSAAIQRLAEDSNWPVPVVAEMYWHELAQLRERATVKAYLGLVTAHKVREALRHMPVRR